VYQATTTPIPKGERSSGCCSCASTGICTVLYYYEVFFKIVS